MPRSGEQHQHQDIAVVRHRSTRPAITAPFSLAALYDVPVPEKASLITALIVNRPVCTDCIGTKATLISGAVEAYLTIMGRVLRIGRGEGKCAECGAITQVVWCSLMR